MDQTVAVDTKFMQEVNSAATLGQLRAAGRMSVAALAERTGLSRQAVTRSLGLLQADGYVEISEPDRSAARSGRPPQMVRFRSELAFVVGIDVNPGSIRVAIADLSGETVAEWVSKIEHDSVDALSICVRDTVLAALRSADVAPDRVWHASIAAPGIVDVDTGVVTFSPNMPHATGDIIAAAARAILSCHIDVDNDVKLATQGERWRGGLHTNGTLVFIDWSERIGAGIVVDGELFRGASNDSGDLGYLDLLVDADHDGVDGPLGPFERWIGTRELRRIASNSRGGGSVASLEDIADAANRGETWALQSVRTVATRFSKGIAALRAILDPDLVVIGGDIAILGTVMLDAVNDALRSQTLNQPRLEVSRLGADAIIQGAIHNSLSAIERDHFALRAARRKLPERLVPEVRRAP